jgi:copper resistance protein C
MPVIASMQAAILVALCGLMAFAPRAAFAHAVLVASTPKAESTVSGPDLNIVLKYNSRVDRARSSISLLAPDGKAMPLALSGPFGPDLLSAKATGLTKGAYVLRWTALSSDGHITRGEIAFKVQ